MFVICLQSLLFLQCLRYEVCLQHTHFTLNLYAVYLAFKIGQSVFLPTRSQVCFASMKSQGKRMFDLSRYWRSTHMSLHSALWAFPSNILWSIRWWDGAILTWLLIWSLSFKTLTADGVLTEITLCWWRRCEKGGAASSRKMLWGTNLCHHNARRKILVPFLFTLEFNASSDFDICFISP